MTFWGYFDNIISLVKTDVFTFLGKFIEFASSSLGDPRRFVSSSDG